MPGTLLYRLYGVAQREQRNTRRNEMTDAASRQADAGTFANLQNRVALWPKVRPEVEQRLAEHSRRDPALYFEPRLAEIELKDGDKAIYRPGVLIRMLASGLTTLI
jgi:hypothetical protein